jgi:hypothetical protein
LEWNELKKLSLDEIRARGITIDFISYLTNSEPLKDVCVKVSLFEFEDSSSAILGLLLEGSFFERLKTLKEREYIIKKFERFPKSKVFKSIDALEYHVIDTIRHSTKVLEIKLAVDQIGDVTVKELPYRIRWIWNDIIERFR